MPTTPTFDRVMLVRDLERHQPRFHYVRFAVNQTRLRTTIGIPAGFNALLKRITAKWNETSAAGFSPIILCEITNGSQNQPIQQNPFPLELISTPAQDGVTVAAAPLPGDAAIFGVVFTATPRLIHKTINCLVEASGRIEIELSGFVVAGLPAVNRPSYVDFLAEYNLSPIDQG